jgi:hypothetical protein
MTNYKGGDTVKRGFYASLNRWTIELVERDDSPLPGTGEERYARLPVPVMLVVAPLMGAGFVIFLPLIGFVLLGTFAYRKLTGKSTPMFDQKPDQFRKRA